MAIRSLPARRPIDVAAYYRMVEVGILGPEDRVELIGGEIIDMVPIGSDHACTTGDLVRKLTLALGDAALVTGSSPLRIDDYNEPEPDVLVLRWRDDRYRSALPGPADVLLLLEVANTSLAFDRTTKAALYAAAGVADYWIVDLAGRSVEVCREPGPAGFANRARIATGSVAPLAFPDLALDVADLFG